MASRLSSGRPRRVSRWGRFVASVLVGAFALVTLVRALAVDSYGVPTPSMAPTLLPGQRILVLTWPWQREPAAGDVVVVDGRGTLAPNAPDSPARTGAWLVGRNAGDQFVKRVIAVGPARVTCDGAGGPLLVDGAPADVFRAEDCGRKRFDQRIPKGTVWLMGDNRENSRDSRDLLGAPGGGAISESSIVGRVLGAQ
ncbi:signal peptidase I [Falsarthrobacter nasiphocae]|uniref:Signal peptidase I n=1 Tax=Falsarthrobacter nasiphocae TaxID=189863 RepID=A0AAE3YFH9_9MICC|nr:signal peptidase I [Falsarthrobacter nasiphocae]MDR6892863.1 signal peptidase I [Falsarthrobacter nasiphocae]